MEVKFLDLKKINKRFEQDHKRAFDEFLESGHYILGSKTNQFETAFAKYCGSRYCLGVANGLDALILILTGLINLGKLKKGDCVAIQGNTFVATALAAIHTGLSIEVLTPRSGANLTAEDIESQISSKTKCVILVHLYGQMRDTENIANFCQMKNILLVEDSAQAHGAEWNGKRAGTYGIASGFSFYPGKNLGALGDGGAVTTDDEELHEEIVYLRNYGAKIKYHHEKNGFNSRLDELQAAFMLPKLAVLDEDNKKRQEIAAYYTENIKKSFLTIDIESVVKKSHTYHLYTIHSDRRDELQNYLKKEGIDTLIHYPYSIQTHDSVRKHIVSVNSNYDEKRLNQSILSLPVSPLMDEKETEYVVKKLNSF